MADERNARHADTLTQLLLLFEEWRNVKAFLSSAGSSQKRLLAADMKSAIETNKMELKTLFVLASKKSTLRVEVIQLKAFVKTLGREETAIVTIIHDMREFSSHFMKACADVKVLRMPNIELSGEVREKDARAAVLSAKLKVVKDKLASVKMNLVASRVEGANYRWSTHNIANGPSRVEDVVWKALMAVSRKVADTTKQKGAFNELELKVSLNRL